MELELTSLIWDEFNITHITKHGVSVEEVEAACRNQLHVLTSYNNRQMLFGVTNKSRYLTIILEKNYSNHYYVVTARDISRKERKYVHDQVNQ
ncbi:BrnT family toxin [Candidatus Woesebacteria bacterium]|nr:BrnT family toxin [Candidatus Woesebacteria bacterium]